MSFEYQQEDREGFDYQLYPYGPLMLRGPKPKLVRGEYFACVSAAQGFGRYVESPYPNLLSARFSMDCLNLSVGGAGPAMFMQPELLDGINASRFAIVQILSGRSSSNSFFNAKGAALRVQRQGLVFPSVVVRDGVLGSRLNAGRFSPVADDLAVPVNAYVHAGLAYRLLLDAFGKDFCDVIRSETRLRHTLEMMRLLSQIRVPRILLYFSEREPDDINHDYRNAGEFLGDFPHFVDHESIGLMSMLAEETVVCVTRRGKPHVLSQPLSMRMPDGSFKQVTTNAYYPSPEMQEDVAKALEPAIRRVMAPSQATRA